MSLTLVGSFFHIGIVTGFFVRASIAVLWCWKRTRVLRMKRSSSHHLHPQQTSPHQRFPSTSHEHEGVGGQSKESNQWTPFWLISRMSFDQLILFFFSKLNLILKYFFFLSARIIFLIKILSLDVEAEVKSLAVFLYYWVTSKTPIVRLELHEVLILRSLCSRDWAKRVNEIFFPKMGKNICTIKSL